MPDDLARRLRELRGALGVTQVQLAVALGVSEPLISSWESRKHPQPPPEQRLKACAEIFTLYRVERGHRLRRIPERELTAEDRRRCQALESDLLSLRSRVLNTRMATEAQASRDLWRFDDASGVTIVCGELSADLLDRMPYTDRRDPDYVRLYTYSDLDSLVELYGYLRAANPRLRVRYRLARDLTEEDYTTHLVALGGVDFNVVTRRLIDKLNLPVTQIGFFDDMASAAFVVRRGDRVVNRFVPRLGSQPGADGKRPLLEDVAHFLRGPNPFNRQRTFTVCNGMYGRGVLGAVKSLTDEAFRERNTGFVSGRFTGGEVFSIVFGVEPYEDTVHTPDWTAPGTVLHTWSDGD